MNMWSAVRGASNRAFLYPRLCQRVRGSSRRLARRPRPLRMRARRRTRGELQKRIDKLVAQRGDFEFLYHSAEAKRQAAEARLAALEQPAQAAQPAAAQPGLDPAGPDLNQFLAAGKTYEDWIDARIEFRAQRIADARIAQERDLAGQRVAEQTLQSHIATFPERAAAVRQSHPDFDTVVAENTEVSLSPVMQHVCLEHPRGAEMMYWLGTHPDVANTLGEITQGYPPAAYRLMEHQLVSLLPDAGTPPSGASGNGHVSAAPAPITPLGGGSTAAHLKPLDELPLGEYIKRRNAEAQQRRTGGVR
jgi:hypothetical protein